jgi:hypothetical protein
MKNKYSISTYYLWVVVVILTILIVYYQSKSVSLKKENIALEQNITEWENISIFCLNNFKSCYNDLKSCIAYKYNLTEGQLDLILNLTGKL